MLTLQTLYFTVSILLMYFTVIVLSIYVDLDFLDVNNLQLQSPGSFNGLQAYKNSKLCNILTAYYMAGLLKGQHVMVHAVDPGKLISVFCYFHIISMSVRRLI